MALPIGVNDKATEITWNPCGSAKNKVNLLITLKEGQFFVLMFSELDECLEGIAGCSHQCENTQGSYLCLWPVCILCWCFQRWMSVWKELQAVATSVRTPRAPTSVSDLYVFVLMFSEVDECLERTAGCSHHWEHLGLLPLSLTSMYLVSEVDECLEGTAGCNHQCENTQGS